MLKILCRVAPLAAVALALLASACGPSQPPLPGPFDRVDLSELTDNDHGAEMRAEVLYHYLKKDHDPRLKVPDWIDAERTELSRPIYQDPDDGALTEAQLWQAPFSVLYEFYEITRKTFPPEYGGSLAKPLNLSAEYRDNDERMKLAVGRLRSLHLEGSLGGRGRAAIDMLEKISVSIDGIAGSLTARDDTRFKASVMAASAGTGDLYRLFRAPPK